MTEAAARLGVHYMTMYKYVRHGRVAATLEGGQWRISSDALEQFLRERAEPPTTRRGGSRPDRYRPRLLARLIAGDEAGAWAVCESAIASGMQPADVYIELLGPALATIGDQWSTGEIDVADEHRASVVASRIIGRLGPRFATRGRLGGTVVVGCVVEDPHSIPAAMLADILRQAGFRVSDLGANVPPESFANAVAEAERLRAVCVSASTESSLGRAAETISAIRAAAPGVPVLIGGPAVVDLEAASRAGADGWARNGTEAVAMIRDLVGSRRPVR
jgi:MerR family transcriptional regulator, light-induced transcriptional regulator